MKTTQKTKLGRPKGSVSFANLTLEELNERFSPKQLIPVSRLFLEKQMVNQIAHITGMSLKDTQSTFESIHKVFGHPAPENAAQRVEMALKA